MLGRRPGIEFTLSQALVAHQRRGARNVAGGDLELGLRAVNVGLGLLDRERVGARIDDEQEVALLDDLALLEMDGVDEPGNAGADLDGLQRRKAAGIFVPFGDGLLQRARDGDGRGRGSRAGDRLAVATGQQLGREQDRAQNNGPGDNGPGDNGSDHRILLLTSWIGAAEQPSTGRSFRDVHCARAFLDNTKGCSILEHDHMTA